MMVVSWEDGCTESLNQQLTLSIAELTESNQWLDLGEFQLSKACPFLPRAWIGMIERNIP